MFFGLLFVLAEIIVVLLASACPFLFLLLLLRELRSTGFLGMTGSVAGLLFVVFQIETLLAMFRAVLPVLCDLAFVTGNRFLRGSVG